MPTTVSPPPGSDTLFRRTGVRYLFALCMLVVAAGLRILLIPLTGLGAPFVLFFAATLVTALFAGTGPGLLVLAGSLPLGAYLFDMRAGTTLPHAIFQAGLYGIDGLVILYLTALNARRRRMLDAANRELARLRDDAERAAARTRDTIELAPDAFVLADLDARITGVNQASCRLFGYDRDELIGMTLFEIVRSEDAGRLEQERADLMVPGATAKGEWLARRKDGTLVPVEVSANILSDGRWQAFVRDISERKRVEDQRQVFLSLLDNSVDFIGIADPSGKPIYLNAAGRRMIGLAPDFPIEQLRMQDCYPPDLQSFVTDVLLKTMMARGVWSGETFFQHFRTHERIPVSDTHFLIRDATGERILGMGTVTRDISETRRIADEREQALARERETRRRVESANAELRESEERFRLTIENAPIGMALVALDGRFVRVNRVLCEITGYSADELTTRRFQDITHPDDVGADVGIAQQLARGDIMRYQFEKRYIRKDGSVVDAMLSVSILRGPDEAPRYFISQMQDITERKRDELALQQAVSMRDDVLRIVAHDLRNPLNAIIMQASAMERFGPEPERRDPRPRQIISRAATRMNQLIQDLLDVALVETGQFTVDRCQLPVGELLRDTVEMESPIAAGAKLALRFEVKEGVHEVWGDRKRLLQVFENLIGNAIKFTPPGGEIVVQAAPNGDDVLFSVADTGTGMAPSALEHAFDRFWQAATAANRLGAGLGLPITKGIVEAHGGRIWVDSALGQGSTFWFTIPTKPREPSLPGGQPGPRDTGRQRREPSEHTPAG